MGDSISFNIIVHFSQNFTVYAHSSVLFPSHNKTEQSVLIFKRQ